MASSQSSPQRVLVVDDDRVLRMALSRLLAASYDVREASDGPEALEKAAAERFDLVLLDIGLPGLSGLEVLARLNGDGHRPRVVMMTADDTPQTLLQAIRNQAYDYIVKPFPPSAILAVASKALAAPDDALKIQVLSARPEWVELLVPCSLDVADRLQNFVMRLDTQLPDAVRESVGMAFRELLCNAIEWGGKLDPTRQVRIACLRSKRMLLYRIADPGQGFQLADLAHAAISNAPDRPLDHALVREEQGLRAGGFGIFLVREMVDELIYNEAHNEVVFVKYLD
jgi:CheY-like chemotaxis protein/anti-sigma regulatory factor (Ser/Thr protein kinase)